MASVEKRTDGRSGYVVRWRDEAGKQRKKSFAKKALADRYRAEVEHSLNVGSYVDPVAGKATLHDYAERWRAAQPHRPNTALNTKSRLKVHIYPVLGKRPISAIRTSELQAFVTGLPLAPGAVRPVWGTLRAIIGAAVRDRLIGWDPCKGVKLPELELEQIVPLTVEQIGALVAAMEPRYRVLVLVGAGTGLRQGELFGLEVRDVDFLRRTVRVERQVQPADGGGTRVCPPKNRNSYRTIPVGRTVVDGLALHLRDYPAQGETFVFRDERGEALHRGAFNAGPWNAARAAAGLPEVGMHDLRHFYASVLIRAGRNVKTVSERLGHANAAMTLNVYSHLWPQDDDLDRQAVDDVFAPAPRSVPATPVAQRDLDRDVPRMRPAKGSSA